MALLLADADRLSVPASARAVVETIITRSSVFDVLPFEMVAGTQFQYPVESTLPTASFVGVNAILGEDAPTFTQTTVSLKIIEVQSDIDKYLLKTRSNIMDQLAVTRDKQAKAIRNHWLDTFFYGDNSTFSDEFSGLHKLIDNDNQSTAIGGPLTLSSVMTTLHKKAKLDLTAILLNSEIMTRLSNGYQILSNANWRLGADDFGRAATTFNGIPLIIEDSITQTEANTNPPTRTGALLSSMFFIATGPVEQGLMTGLLGDDLFQVSQYELHNKNAIRSRIVAYSALVAPRFSVSRIQAISAAAVTA